MTHGLLGEIARAVPGVYVDFAFMPPAIAARAMLRDAIPPLFGTSSRRTFRDFDLLAITNSVAQELWNLPWLLAASGIPLTTPERLARPLPLLLMGGANAASAFIALGSATGASLVDALYLGSAAENLPRLLESLIALRSAGLAKPEQLATLAAEFPCLVTAATEGARQPYRPPKPEPGSARLPLWYHEETLGTGALLVDRGCPHLCRFCKEAWEHRPYAPRPRAEILAQLEEAKRLQGLSSVSLHSFNFASHPEAEEILAEARGRIHQVTIKSQRFDGLLQRPALLEHFRHMGLSTFTFGLEGISERIRTYLHKGVTGAEIQEALSRVFATAVRRIKLFLILTGNEQEEDFAEFGRFLAWLAGVREESGPNRETPVIFSLCPLIPMPHTPLAFAPFPKMETHAAGRERLRSLTECHDFQLRESVGWEEARIAYHLLCGGAEETAALIAASSRERYYEGFAAGALSALEAELPAPFLAAASNERAGDCPLPWGRVTILRSGEPALLHAEYLRARAELARGSPPSPRRPLCTVPERTAPATPVGRVHEQWFLLRTSARLAGVTPRFFQVDLARTLGLTDKIFSANYLRPGPFLSPTPEIPSSGILACALILRYAPLPLPLSAGTEWKMLAVPGGNPAGDAMLLELQAPEWMTRERLYEAQRALTEAKLPYAICKGEGRVTCLIKAQQAKRAGLFQLTWDFAAERVRLAVNPTGVAEGLLDRLGIPRFVRKHARPLYHRTFARRAGECPRCHGPLWQGTLPGADLPRCGG